MSTLPNVYAGILLIKDAVILLSDEHRQKHIEELKKIISKNFHLSVKSKALTSDVAYLGINTMTPIAVEECWSVAKANLESIRYIQMAKRTSGMSLTPQEPIMPPKRVKLRSLAEIEADKLAKEEKTNEAQEKLAKMAVGNERPGIKYSLQEYKELKRQREEDEESLQFIREEFEKMAGNKENIKPNDLKRRLQGLCDFYSDDDEQPVINKKRARGQVRHR